MTRPPGLSHELDMMPAKPERLACRAGVEDGTLVLRLSGGAEQGDQAQLGLLLQQRQLAKARVDLSGLKFMDSSCLKAFVGWLSLATAAVGAAQGPIYRVHFTLNPGWGWQRVSISALACFAMNLVTFE